MEPEQLRALLNAVRDGKRSPEEALEALRTLPFEDLGYAQVNHHRFLRQGFPEVILGQGKTAEQIVGIASRLRSHDVPVLVTRISPAAAAALATSLTPVTHHELARCAIVGEPLPATGGTIAVVSAGTSDVPVAEEAAITATVMGNVVERLYDVGVAGLHRLLARQALLQSARVIVVVAGMEALCPASSAGWCGCRSSPCRPASATAPLLADWRRCSAC